MEEEAHCNLNCSVEGLELRVLKASDFYEKLPRKGFGHVDIYTKQDIPSPCPAFLNNVPSGGKLETDITFNGEIAFASDPMRSVFNKTIIIL